MIGHVYHRSKLCSKLDDLYVATCDVEIRDYIESIGGKVVVTSDKHHRASERTAEAIQNIEMSSGEAFDFVAMIQGDLPSITPDVIGQLIAPLEDDPGLKVVDMISQIQNEEEFENPNNVKVVMDLNDCAMYYSREPIPSRKKYDGSVPMWRQPGLILFEKTTLLNYVALRPTPLEIIESVDMNRLLEHGIKIKFARTAFTFLSIDVPEDKDRVFAQMKDDPYFVRYLGNA
jgi:3-deoxy-manno-octulosonate cytidylyltransferase (CMP-KDO synthetase)